MAGATAGPTGPTGTVIDPRHTGAAITAETAVAIQLATIAAGPAISAGPAVTAVTAITDAPRIPAGTTGHAGIIGRVKAGPAVTKEQPAITASGIFRRTRDAVADQTAIIPRREVRIDRVVKRLTGWAIDPGLTGRMKRFIKVGLPQRNKRCIGRGRRGQRISSRCH